MLIESWINFNRMHGGIEGARSCFEKLCFEILQLEYPKEEVHTIGCNPGDHGIDVFVGSIHEHFKIYQCKYFLETLKTSQWKQIELSLESVVKDIHKTKLKEWFLCIPKELTFDEMIKFQNFIEIYKRKYDFEIKCLDGNDLINLAKKHKLDNKWFGHKNYDFTYNFICPKQNDKFITRVIYNDILDFIRNDNVHTYIKGIGGIGKTTFLNYINIILFNEFDYIFKIDYQNDLLSSFCEYLGFENDENIIENLSIFFTKNVKQKNLLLIDNCPLDYLEDENRDFFEKYTKIVIASRLNLDLPYYRTFEINDLNIQEAVTIFLKYYEGNTDKENLNKIFQFMKDIPRNPLLIEMISRAANKELMDLETFLDKIKYENYDYSMAKVQHYGVHSQQRIIEHLMSLYDFENLSTEYRKILYVFTTFPEFGVDIKFLSKININFDYLNSLIEFGWLRKNGMFLSMHNLIRTCIELQEPNQYVGSLDDLAKYFSNRLLYENISEKKFALRNIHIIIRMFYKYDIKNTDHLYIWYNFYQSIYILKIEAMIEAFLEECVDCISEFDEIKSKKVLCDVYNTIGLMHNDFGNKDIAISYFEKVLEIIKINKLDSNPSLASIYCNLGIASSDYSKSEKYLKKSLKLYIGIYGKNSIQSADIYHNLGANEFCVKNYEKALEYFFTALNIRIKKNVKDVQYAKTLACIANTMKIKLDKKIGYANFDEIYSLEIQSLLLFLENNEILNKNEIENYVNFCIALKNRGMLQEAQTILIVLCRTNVYKELIFPTLLDCLLTTDIDSWKMYAHDYLQYIRITYGNDSNEFHQLNKYISKCSHSIQQKK